MRRKMQLALGLPDETVTAIMMFFKNTKAVVHLPKDGTDSFEIGVLHGDTLAPYIFITALISYKENQ